MAESEGAPKEELQVTETKCEPSLAPEAVTLFLDDWSKVNVIPGNFKEVCFTLAKATLEKYGGPQQYLEAMVGANLQEVTDQLLAEFPLRQDVTYKTALDMPRETGVDFQVHLKDLSFSKVSSTKPVTYLTTSISLVDQYLSHGFLCSGSEAPVLLWDGPKASGSNTHGWVSCVKGMARCSSLLFLAHFTMSQGWNLTVLHPSLYSSMTIYI